MINVPSYLYIAGFFIFSVKFSDKSECIQEVHTLLNLGLFSRVGKVKGSEL